MSFLSSVVAWFADPANWTGSGGIPTRLLEHLQISGESVAIAGVIALPIGIGLGHYGRFGALALNVSNVGRALPSFGILVIAFQVFGLGNLPVILALTALAIPPMVTNSYVGMREVDPDIKEAARGMGYRELAQLFRVELPLAVPLVMAGIRTSAVQVVHQRRLWPAGLHRGVRRRAAGGPARPRDRVLAGRAGKDPGAARNPPAQSAHPTAGDHVQIRLKRDLSGRIRVYPWLNRDTCRT